MPETFLTQHLDECRKSLSFRPGYSKKVICKSSYQQYLLFKCVLSLVLLPFGERVIPILHLTCNKPRLLGAAFFNRHSPCAIERALKFNCYFGFSHRSANLCRTRFITASILSGTVRVRTMPIEPEVDLREPISAIRSPLAMSTANFLGISSPRDAFRSISFRGDAEVLACADVLLRPSV